MTKPLTIQSVTLSEQLLARGHFAAFRAWLEGLPIHLVAGRYLGYIQDEDDSVPDARLLLRQLREIGNALVRHAHQLSRPCLASDLEFGMQHPDIGWNRAANATYELERLGAGRPVRAHAVELWFAPALARRLRAAELTTIERLIDACNDRGHSWYRRVPRIGVKAADAIVAWLRQHEHTIGKAIGAHVTRTLDLPALPVSRRPELIDGRTRAVPPLEAIRLPAYCDGSSGENRADRERCALTARNDYEAVLTWLSLWPEGSPTRRAHRKEAERFLAWAVIERAKGISSLKTEDCIAYRDFLANPQPAERWCGPMLARSLPGWRPFQGALSPTSQKYAQTVLRRLCEFLTRKHFLHVNPWDEVPPLQRVPYRIQTEKALSIDLWKQLATWLDQQASEPDAAQMRLARAAIFLLRDTGIRLVEACRADRAGIVPLDDPDSDVYGELSVLGKRDKLRDVPLSRRAVEALRGHWIDRREDFDRAATGPLLRPLRLLQTTRAKAKAARGDTSFSTSGLHTIIATTLERFAATLPPEEQAQIEKAARTRAHALRHTFGTHSADNDVPVDVLQDIFGHASMSTTTIYTRPGRKRRLREIGKLYKG